ncbi:MAG: YHS domain-containing protein, partial [Rhodospirillaceae bacterium]|nr:YHS domain-containing protein [Rhodospirillaceae bacterium]
MTQPHSHTGQEHRHQETASAPSAGACCAHHGKPSDVSNTVKDPVCGMDVDPATTKHHADYAGKTHYFCSAGCRIKFIGEPSKYLNKAGRPPPPADEGAIYTCPMHPEIRQVGPGSCPICGMALEPVAVSAESGPNPELRDMTRRFWIGLALALPVVALEMGAHLVDLHHIISARLSMWLQFVLATPVVLWAGWPFFVRGWQSIITRKLNMFTLIALGTGVAWLYSVVATLLPDAFPAEFHSTEGAVAIYYEAAAVITVLVLLGQVLELRAREETSGAIKALLNLAPKVARRIKSEGAEEEVALDDVQIGDRLRVRPGDKIPVDGKVVEGRSAVDESMVTGESMPVTKEIDGAVIGGTLNQSGALIIIAEKVGHETMLARIVQMVADAQRSRAPIQRLADQVSSWFV